MSGLCLAPAWRRTETTVVCVDKDAVEDRRRSSRARCRSTSPAWRRWSGATTHEERLTLHAPTSPSAVAGLGHRLHRGRHAAGRGRLRRSAARARRWPATSAAAMNNYTVVVDKSTVPVGTARSASRRDRRRDDAAVQRGQQPGIPQAGRGDRGLHEAGSRRRRHRRRATQRAAEIMRELYAPFTRTGAPIMMMDTASAELCEVTRRTRSWRRASRS